MYLAFNPLIALAPFLDWPKLILILH